MTKLYSLLFHLCFVFFMPLSLANKAQDPELWNDYRKRPWISADVVKDNNMPNTCIKSKDPLPSVICSPVQACDARRKAGVFDPIFAPNEARPMACYLLPSGPVCCSYCPPQWAAHCP